MIHSMTAFGQASGRILNREVLVEIRSVNTRFRDILVRTPKAYSALEEDVKTLVSHKASRGRIEVSIQVYESETRWESLSLNLDLAKAYHNLLEQLKDELDLPGGVELSHLAGVRDIIVYEEETLDLEEFKEGMVPILNEALDKLVQMRAVEGRAIAADFSSRLDAMVSWVNEIASRKETVFSEAKAKLGDRIKALTGDLELDEGRLLQEAAYIADRSDITEEIIRLKSHLSQFRSCLQDGGVIGRRMEFLLQEINREVNTVGSKVGDLIITNLVVDLKSELEKLREQIQNIE